MAVPSNENYVAALLIGTGSRSIEARLAALEGIQQYGPNNPEYFPDIDARKMSIFGYDQNGNPGYFSVNSLSQFVPLAFEIEGPPVDGDITYSVTGTVSYSTGSGTNSALPGEFQRIPSYNAKPAFSSTGAIFLDINDADDLPFGQGYFTGSQFWLELKTVSGVSRFYGTSTGQIESVTNWTAFSGETGANSIDITAPTDVTIAAPGQIIEDITDTSKAYVRLPTGTRAFPLLDANGNLEIEGIIPRPVPANQITTDVPDEGELVILPDHSNCTAVGDGESTVKELKWSGILRVNVTAAWLATDAADIISGALVIPANSGHIDVQITENVSATIPSLYFQDHSRSDPDAPRYSKTATSFCVALSSAQTGTIQFSQNIFPPGASMEGGANLQADGDYLVGVGQHIIGFQKTGGWIPL